MRPNPQEIADLITLAEDILDGLFIFCAVRIRVFSDHKDRIFDSALIQKNRGQRKLVFLHSLHSTAFGMF